MAKIFCSSDSIVVAADTTLFVFQYAITDANLHIELTRTVDVDIKLTTVPDSEVVEDDDENAAEAVNSLNEKKQKLPEAEKQVEIFVKYEYQFFSYLLNGVESMLRICHGTLSTTSLSFRF